MSLFVRVDSEKWSKWSLYLFVRFHHLSLDLKIFCHRKQRYVLQCLSQLFNTLLRPLTKMLPPQLHPKWMVNTLEFLLSHLPVTLSLHPSYHLSFSPRRVGVLFKSITHHPYFFIVYFWNCVPFSSLFLISLFLSLSWFLLLTYKYPESLIIRNTFPYLSNLTHANFTFSLHANFLKICL